MVDLYTKTVLTVIAAALVTLVAQHGLKQAVAQTDIIPCGNANYNEPPCMVTWTNPLPVLTVLK